MENLKISFFCEKHPEVELETSELPSATENSRFVLKIGLKPCRKCESNFSNLQWNLINLFKVVDVNFINEIKDTVKKDAGRFHLG